jgi:hypothetical protein
MSEPDGIEARIAAATAVFEKDVGVWDAESEIHPGPGAPPIVQKGTWTNRRIGSGRWLVVDYQADSGYEGHGVYGWDPATEKYIGTWVDSMQRTIAYSEGTWDAATRTMTFVTEITHQGQPVRYREVTQTLADGHQVYRNLVPTPDGGEFEMIRITAHRRG